MKSVCIALVFFGVVACTLAAMDKEAAKKRFMQCKDDEKVTDKDIEDLHKSHELNSDGAKRLIRCLFTMDGILKDGKFDKEALIKGSERMHEGADDKEKKMAIDKEVAEACEGIVGAGGATPEDTAEMIFKCIKDESHKHGIPPPDHAE